MGGFIRLSMTWALLLLITVAGYEGFGRLNLRFVFLLLLSLAVFKAFAVILEFMDVRALSARWRWGFCGLLAAPSIGFGVLHYLNR